MSFALLTAPSILFFPSTTLSSVFLIPCAVVNIIGSVFSINIAYVPINVLKPFPIAINKSIIPPTHGISARKACTTDIAVFAVPLVNLSATPSTNKTLWSATLSTSGLICSMISIIVTPIASANSLIASLAIGFVDISRMVPAAISNFLFNPAESSLNGVSNIFSSPESSIPQSITLLIASAENLIPVFKPTSPRSPILSNTSLPAPSVSVDTPSLPPFCLLSFLIFASIDLFVLSIVLITILAKLLICFASLLRL